MPYIFTLAILVSASCFSWQAHGALQEEDATTNATEPVHRAVVFVNRSKEVAGYLEFEDDHLILIQSRNGHVESYEKDLLIGIARLVDLDEPAQGVVILRNNSRQRGMIVHDDFDSVGLEINGVPLEINRNRVSHVLLEPPLQEQYLEYRRQVDVEDFASHLALCQWLINRRAYDLAHKELQQSWALHQEPETARLMRTVEAQLQMEEDVDPDGAREDASVAPEENQLPLLSERDVNLIRVYEIDMSNPPRVLVPRDAIKELIEQHATSNLIPDTEEEQNVLLSAESIEIVRLMFRLRARDLYDRIEVVSEPRSLQLFRERVHDTWLMNNCGTTRCHGGSDAGGFRLHRGRITDDRTRYTNLLAIDRYTVEDGTRLIDYDHPERSLLIQYGLPLNQTTTPHPDVPGWAPVFAGSRRSLSEGTETWIKTMMNAPRPNYPVGLETRDEETETDREPR